jgi:NTE family protein
MATRPFQEADEGRRIGLVLSGGGARGAYEAGVLQHIYGPLADRLGFTPRIDIYSGASVGAVHTTFLAANSHEVDGGTATLAQIWADMKFSSVYSFELGDLLGFGGTLMGSILGRQDDVADRRERLSGLLNTSPLERLVMSKVPWRSLRRNLRTGRFHALSVSTTEVATGRTVVFVDTRSREIPRWTRDPHQIARAARISPKHPLASAAIPLLFPAVRIGETFYVDGTLRLHTPLTPALRLGSNRLLIIGLRSQKVAKIDDPVAQERLEQARSAGYLLGKMLNAFLIERLETEVAQMRVLNEALRAGQDEYGPDFLDRINPHIAEQRGIGFNVVEECFVRPSEDIGQIASENVRRLRKQPKGSWIGSLAFRFLTRGAPDREADLMSYLMFDSGYSKDLLELGARDAAAQEEQLAQLFLGQD